MGAWGRRMFVSTNGWMCTHARGFAHSHAGAPCVRLRTQTQSLQSATEGSQNLSDGFAAAVVSWST